MSQGQRTSAGRGMQGTHGAGRRMAVLCAVLMGVFALMTVMILAGPNSKSRLEGSVGYPASGPMPDMVAPGGSSGSSTHAKATKSHATASKPGAAVSLVAVGDSETNVTGAGVLSGSKSRAVATVSHGTSSGTNSSGSSGNKGNVGKAGG